MAAAIQLSGLVARLVQNYDLTLDSRYPNGDKPAGPYLRVNIPEFYTDDSPIDPADVTQVNVYYGTTSGSYSASQVLTPTRQTFGVVTSADPQTWYFVAEVEVDDGGGVVYQSPWSSEVSLSLAGGGTVNVELIPVWP